MEAENRGFDLISRRPHPEDPETAIEVRFIEVKGRSGIGEVALTTNEFKTAERLKKDFWLYVVFNCGSTPQIRIVQDPARLGWEPLVIIEHYHVAAKAISTIRQVLVSLHVQGFRCHTNTLIELETDYSIQRPQRHGQINPSQLSARGPTTTAWE